MSTSLSGYGPKAAASVTNVMEVEKYSSLYDGSLEKYERFISEVTLILKSKDALASHIIAGTIQVQSTPTKRKDTQPCYETRILQPEIYQNRKHYPKHKNPSTGMSGKRL